MPWTYIPKKDHRCRVPFGMFKPMGSKWQCPDCYTVYVKTADMNGSFMVKVD